jgi:hypothetical protein
MKKIAGLWEHSYRHDRYTKLQGSQRLQNNRVKQERVQKILEDII